MSYPGCGRDRHRVVDTEPTGERPSTRRSRERRRCSFRVSSRERFEWDTPQSKTRDGAIEPYESETRRTGIERAVEGRPVAGGAVAGRATNVETELEVQEIRTVSSTLVGDLASNRLRELDEGLPNGDAEPDFEHRS